MSFTYDSTLSDDVSKVRFLIQDNIEEGHYFEDEELSYLLAESTGIYGAASGAAFALYSRFSQALSVATVDDIRIETKDRVKYYKDLYMEFKKKAATGNGKYAPIFIGGADRTEFIRQSAGLSFSGIPDENIEDFFNRGYSDNY